LNSLHGINSLNMILRRAMPTDISELSNLLDLLFELELEFQPNPQQQKKALKTLLYNSQLGDIFVASDNNRVIAMVSMLYTVSTALGGRVAILEDMIVSPKYRSQKVGSQLIEHATEHAKQIGCKRITLLTDNDNEVAQKFYEKHGFEKSSMVVLRKKV